MGCAGCCVLALLAAAGQQKQHSMIPSVTEAMVIPLDVMRYAGKVEQCMKEAAWDDLNNWMSKLMYAVEYLQYVTKQITAAVPPLADTVSAAALAVAQQIDDLENEMAMTTETTTETTEMTAAEETVPVAIPLTQKPLTPQRAQQQVTNQRSPVFTPQRPPQQKNKNQTLLVAAGRNDDGRPLGRPPDHAGN
jgi:hypothetical protein